MVHLGLQTAHISVPFIVHPDPVGSKKVSLGQVGLESNFVGFVSGLSFQKNMYACWVWVKCELGHFGSGTFLWT